MRSAIAAALTWLCIIPSGALGQTPGAPSGDPASREAGRWTISTEAILWWFKDSPAPTPLVSTGPLSVPGSSVVLGGQDVDTNPNPGFRLTTGYALTERWGVEGSVFYVPTRSTSRTVSSSGQPGSQDLVIPFFDVTIPGESSTGLSSAGVFSGTATERFDTNLPGAELDGTLKLVASGPWRLDALGGFRYFRLHENYTFSTSSPNIPPRTVDVFATRDEFDATNNFYGAQLGVRGRFDWRKWFAGAAVRFAMGAMVQSVDISGSLVSNSFNNFGATQTFSGGYFAQPTNIGNHTRTAFAVLPELGLTVGYQITPWASIFLGYSFLYTNNVVRAPQQVNREINPNGAPGFTSPTTPVTGPAEPSFKFNSSDFWAQGLNVGLGFRF